MKTAKLYKPHDIRIEDVEVPSIKDTEVLVRVKAVGVCGSDTHYYVTGGIGSVDIIEPHILGHEIGGIIEKVGKNVTGLSEGTPVAVEPGISCGNCCYCLEGNDNLCLDLKFCGSPPYHGAFREFMPHPADFVYPLPENVSPEEAAIAETLGIGIWAVDLSKIKIGESAAIFGVGPVGLTTLQALKVSGISEFYAVDLVDHRLEMAKKMGANHIINASNTDPVKAINDLTGGRGVDVVFEASGADETPAQSVAVVKPGRRVIIIGINRNDEIILNHSEVRRKGLTIKLVRRMRRTYGRAIDLISKGMIDVKPLITHRMPLERVSEAFDLLDGYKDGVMKAVITFD